MATTTANRLNELAAIFASAALSCPFARYQSGGPAAAKPVAGRRRGAGGFSDAAGPPAAPHGTDSGWFPRRRACGGAPVVFLDRVSRVIFVYLLCVYVVLLLWCSLCAVGCVSPPRFLALFLCVVFCVSCAFYVCFVCLCFCGAAFVFLLPIPLALGSNRCSSCAVAHILCW